MPVLKIKNNGKWETILGGAGGGGGTVDIDLEGAEPGTGEGTVVGGGGNINNIDLEGVVYAGDESVDSVTAPLNADTLGGKTESELSVAKALNADNAATLNGKLESELSVAKAVDSDTLEGKTVNSIVDIIYPIGSIYMSINSASPNTLFGGTWESIEDTFLLAAGSTYAAGTTGGEATHTLTIDEMPSHDHQQYVGANSGTWGLRQDYDKDVEVNQYPQGLTGKTGGSQPHNNMPPYLTVYMWERIA